jgi:hypothetical protein
MAKLNSDLLKQARANLARIVQMEKGAFTPGDAGGMPPSGATAMPPDPSMMGGGAPPMDPSMGGGGAPPMDPMAGGAPPTDPSMMGGPGAGDPAGGPPILQVGANELMQMMQMMQQQNGGAAPAGNGNGGAGAGKGGAKQALEGKIDALIGKVDMLIGFFAAQSGMNAQQLLNGENPPSLGAGGTPGGAEGEQGLIPQVGGEASPAAPPAEEKAAQITGMPPGRQVSKQKTATALNLHNLVGNLLR